MSQRSAAPAGVVCAILFIFLLCSCGWLVDWWATTRIMLPALAAGAGFGCCLAAATRASRASVLYLWLGAAIATFYVLKEPWPHGLPQDWLSTSGKLHTPENRYRMLEMARAAAYVLGIPYPYGQFGRHHPDVKSTAQANQQADS
jgi:hypothetical protein